MTRQQRFMTRLKWALPAGALVAVGAVLAGTMLASAAAPALPRRTAAQLLADLRHASVPPAMSAVISQSANLGIPALPDLGGLPSSAVSATSFLAGTHTIQVWYDGPRHVRIAVPVPFGETDLRVSGNQVWLWQSRGQTATRYLLPSRTGAGRDVKAGPGWAGSAPGGKWAPGGKQAPGGRPPGIMGGAAGGMGPFAGLTPLQAADRLLAMAGRTTSVTVTGTVVVAGRPAYQVAIAPRSDQSLIGRILIAVDARTHLPLEVQVFARGSSSPAFQIGFTSITLGPPAMSNFTFTPPPGARVKVVHPQVHVPGPTPGMKRPAGKHAALRKLRAAPGAGPAGAQVLGSGWLTVAVIPLSQAMGVFSGGGPAPQASGVYHSTPRVSGPAGQGPGLLGLLLKAATSVHGSWGSGRLLRTSLFSVLITSKGQVLIGAVTPAVLYADAAQVK